MTVTGNMNVQIDGGSPWGFRLQGGGNFPLQVIKIRKRSKSYKHLVEGDVIIRVNGIPVQGKTHEGVMDMVDATAGLLNLEIYRGEALHKIPKTAPVHAPVAAVAPASQASNRASTLQTTQHSMQQHTTEESMRQQKISSQQMSSQQTSHSVHQEQQHLQQQHHQQQQQVTKSNIVLQNKVQQQQVTQRQLSSGWQQSNNQMAQHQQQQSAQHAHSAQQHQQVMTEQQTLAQQHMTEQQDIRQQLAHQRHMSQHQQHQHSEQQSMQSMSSTQQMESHHEEKSSVSTAMWTSAQSSQETAQHAIVGTPKPFKPKIAGHLPLRDPVSSPVKASPPPPKSPTPVAPTPPPHQPRVHLYDKENVAPSPAPPQVVPGVNVPQFNVKNVKNLVNQDWNEVALEELDLPVPDYSKRMVITPSSPRELSPIPMKKEILIPDMTIKPAPPVAPKPKRVLAEVQPQEAEPWIPDSDIVPIQPPDRPHLPIFGPPVVYGLNPALAPQRSNSLEQEESVVSETSSGSRRNDPNYEAKKQKIYSDSSFYYDPKGVYPTIEEQIDLCKKISNSLTAAANSRARGATMFAKRQKRSAKWIHDGFSEGMVADLQDLYSELDASEGGTKPLFQFRIPNLASQISVETPSMSLSREEFETLKSQPKVDHKALNPNAMGILSDLQNSKGRGAKLFAKRQARCEKWVVDDKSATSASAPVTPSEAPAVSITSTTEMMNVQNRLADMIQKPMPIIQHQQQQQQQAAPQPAPKPVPVFQPHPVPVFQPQPVNKHIGVALPTSNADLKAEFKVAFDGPNFNRKARGWNAGPVEPAASSDL